MKTLIELYDERPIENVLSPEVFRPERTIYLCPAEIAQNRKFQKTIRDFFKHRGIDTEAIFLECSLFNTEKIKRQLRRVMEEYEDCVLDITGGTDAALFAGGLMCAESGMPAFTYSRKQNRFYNILNATFADDIPCEVEYRVEDCFKMAGGAMRRGRVDNAILENYMDMFDSFFALYLKYRSNWTHLITYMQRASQTEPDTPIPLLVNAPYTVKGELGSRITAPENELEELEDLGLIKYLEVEEYGRVRFEFADHTIRTWLRDIGSVLELYVYKACIDTGIFQDVRTSAVVDWEGSFTRDGVTNEIDVMAMQGIIPAFISCKTCAVSTEALNELAILRDRFGGEIARAAIVTTTRCRNVTRNRAQELGIDVIDLDDLLSERIGECIKTMMRKK